MHELMTRGKVARLLGVNAPTFYAWYRSAQRLGMPKPHTYLTHSDGYRYPVWHIRQAPQWRAWFRSHVDVSRGVAMRVTKEHVTYVRHSIK